MRKKKREALRSNRNRREEDKLSDLVRIAEELGLVFADAGLPEIAGRVLGWLLVCDPPEQSLEQLRVASKASRASISNMTRLLLHFGFIERGGGGPSRVILYRLRSDPWTPFSEKRLETTRRLVALGERALGTLHWMPADRRRRLEVMSQFWAFLLERNEGFIEEWKQFGTKKDKAVAGQTR
jgi:hypothetical protein